MEKCNKCESIISDNDPMAWKCTECGKAFRVNLSKLKKLQLLKNKPENAGKMLLKCSTCGNGIDNGNEKIACKCSACGNIMMGKLRDFAGEDIEKSVTENQIVNVSTTHPNISSNFIKCLNCGNSIPNNVKFCPECGCSITTKKKKKNIKFKFALVCIPLIFLLLSTPIVLMYFGVINNPFSLLEKETKQEINFNTLGISENCYTDTLLLINKYYNSEFENKIREIYSNFGTSLYNKDTANRNIDDIKREIRDDYYQLYSTCDNDNEKQIILFGYNFSLFCEIQYTSMALNTSLTDDPDSINSIQEYYDQFVSAPSLDLVDNFCAYSTKNHIGYATTIYKASIEDVAYSINVDLHLANLSINVSASYLKNQNITSAYNEFCDAADNYQKILDTLDEYPEYKDKFLSMDISEAEEILNNSKKCYNSLADAYTRRETEAISQYTNRLVSFLDDIIAFAGEIEKNVKQYNSNNQI